MQVLNNLGEKLDAVNFWERNRDRERVGGGGGKIIDVGPSRQLVMVILFFTVIYKNTHKAVIICVIICAFGHPLYLGHVPVWFRLIPFVPLGPGQVTGHPRANLYFPCSF